MDRNQSFAPATLPRWMAAAGSTPLGQTTVHSPTKVHSHTPTGPRIDYLPVTITRWAPEERKY